MSSAEGIADQASVFTGTVRLVIQPIALEDSFIGILKGIRVSVNYADGSKEELTSNEKGVINVQNNRGVHADLKLDVDGAVRDMRIFINLDEASTPKGAWQRLVNMGYTCRLQPSSEPSEDDLTEALEEFQSDHGLPVTGELDNITRSTIISSYESSSPLGEEKPIVTKDKLTTLFGKRLKDSIT